MKQRLGRDVDSQLADLLLALVQAIGKQVGEGGDLDVLLLDRGVLGHVLGVVAELGIDDLGGCPEGVEQCAGAAAAATDQPDADFTQGVGLGGVGHRQIGRRRGSGDGRGSLGGIAVEKRCCLGRCFVWSSPSMLRERVCCV